MCFAALALATVSAQAADSKPRVIATTDGEIDDHSSMIRFLLYTCDFDVAGIVEVNSRFQKSGHSKEPWLENQLAAYEQVLPRQSALINTETDWTMRQTRGDEIELFC